MSESRSAGHNVQHAGALARVGRWCATHAWRTLGIWLVSVIAVIVVSTQFGGTLVDRFEIPNSDSQRALDLLQDRFPEIAGESATVVFAADSGTLDDPANRAAVTAGLAAADTIPGVTSVGEPFGDGHGAGMSDDSRVAFADVQFDRQSYDIPAEDVEKLQADVSAAVEAAGGGVTVEYTGSVIQAQQVPETGIAELLGLVAALIILLVVFGVVVAAGLPIVMALLSVGLGAMLLLILARFWDFNTITPTLAVMIGLGVGIDYSLFIVTRFRQALHDGLSPRDAATVATATAGRAVIFAGVTVAISISALAVIGLDFITKLGFGAAVTVIVAVLVANTLLPAILSLLGHRIDKGKIPFVKPPDDSHSGRQNTFFARLGRWTARNAALCVIVPGLALAALAVPALSAIHLGFSDAGSGSETQTTRRAYDLLADGFGPGFNGPLLVAVDQTADPGAADRIAAAIKADRGVESVADPVANDAGDTAQITVFPTTSPSSSETQDLVERLRDEVLPGALQSTNVTAYVGGGTAAFDDIASRIYSRMPLFLLAAVGITFVILTMAFRSVVVALKASVTTLLSALSAAGILVMIFQFGWGLPAIGLDQTGPIESFLPVIVFAILFGLSMDYEVFLVSRIREEYVHGDDPREAIQHGLSAIGRVVAAAGAIMAVVFFAFVLGPDRTIKEFGIALGFAIVIDAFIVRLIMVPAIMHLLDRKAWYIPGWLDRILPPLTIEPPHEPHVVTGATPAAEQGS